MDEVNLREVRRNVSEFIDAATLDNRVIDALRHGDKLVSKECELWDYKEQAGDDKVSLAETVLCITSLYNAYGGYLIYGVKETQDDLEFVPVGTRRGTLNIGQLRQLVKTYTSRDIDVTYTELTTDFAGSNFLIGLLHIPKRPYAQPPVKFERNGPDKQPGHPVFKQNSIYVRLQDKCVPVEAVDLWEFLCSERSNPFLLTTRPFIPGDVNLRALVENNLLDRNFICPDFFGRGEEKEALWRWLADDLSCTKVLAGDGGKGKTSIAYNFAEEVCRTKPYGIEKVIWLTAKQRQFKGEKDEFVRVPRTDFFDTESMLKALCLQLAVLEAETEGASIPLLQKLLKDALSQISCMAVIDDVDSTEPDQQRMILETVMQSATSRGRFLITTRMNRTCSSALCIDVGGLSKEDYPQLLNHLWSQLGSKLPPLKTKQIERMWIVTDGSPLFTESLLRLCRLGMPLETAMRDWKGKRGNVVRQAALQREIEHLLPESRRVLLACALMGEASMTELKRATGYDDQRMMVCLEDLSSLFLVYAKPFVKQEPRFAVSNNTGRLVLEKKKMLVTDPVALEKAVAGLRRGRVGKDAMIVRRSVGSAILQAEALLKDNKSEDALETLDAALNEYRDNPDLLLARGRCLLVLFDVGRQSKHLTMARRAFDKAHGCGQRKEMLYQLWCQAEIAARHPQGAVEVCTLALDNGLPSQPSWLQKRAVAYAEWAMALQQSFNPSGAIVYMRSCISDLGRAMSRAATFEKARVAELLFQASDDLWELKSSMSQDLADLRELFQDVRTCIRAGDSRVVTLVRLVTAAERACRVVLSFDRVTVAQANLIRQTVRETGETLAAHVQERFEEEKLKSLSSRWQSIDSATAHLGD